MKNDIENYFLSGKNLSGQQRLRLNQIFKEFDYLGFLQESWTLKEDFMDALDELNMTEIDRIRDDCLKSEHYRIKQFGRTIKRWYAGIKRILGAFNGGI
ncbi:MAG: transposase [Candidatus Gracilibacteria bacterium]|nr:transposase [Candidatus Gracilibacteria bacterium]